MLCFRAAEEENSPCAFERKKKILFASWTFFSSPTLTLLSWQINCVQFGWFLPTFLCCREQKWHVWLPLQRLRAGIYRPLRLLPQLIILRRWCNGFSRALALSQVSSFSPAKSTDYYWKYFFLSSPHHPLPPLAYTCSVKLARLASRPFGGITGLIGFFCWMRDNRRFTVGVWDSGFREVKLKLSRFFFIFFFLFKTHWA